MPHGSGPRSDRLGGRPGRRSDAGLCHPGLVTSHGWTDESDVSPAAQFAGAALRRDHPHLAEFTLTRPFILDPFQVDACRALEDGHGVLVCAPTGAGKTVVGEFAVHQALATGGKCFYTTPIKALSNQKFADLIAAVRSGPGRPADRRHLDQLPRAGGGDDHRGVAQHAVRRFVGPDRADPRGDGRDPLPGRQVPRGGVGGGDPAPADRGAGGRAVGHRLQRRGVRGLAGGGARRADRGGRRDPTGAAVAAHAGRSTALRPVQRSRPGGRRAGRRPPADRPGAGPRGARCGGDDGPVLLRPAAPGWPGSCGQRPGARRRPTER